MKRLHLTAAAFGFDTPVPAGLGPQALLLVSVTQEDGTGVMGLRKEDFTAALFAFGTASFGLEQPPLSIVRFVSEDAPFYSMVLADPRGGAGSLSGPGQHLLAVTVKQIELLPV